jgi:hypothetical protein
MSVKLSFKNEVLDVFLSHGFCEWRSVVRRDGEGVVTLVGVEKGFGRQNFITVGFLIHRLDPEVPASVEKTHLYFRLERLFPDLRDSIVHGGDASAPDWPEAFSRLLAQLRDTIAKELCSLSSLTALSESLKAGRLENGLVTKSAREVLVSMRTE